MLLLKHESRYKITRDYIKHSAVYRSEDIHRKSLSRYVYDMNVDVMLTSQYLIAHWMQNLRVIFRWLRLQFSSYGRTNVDKIWWSVLCSRWWVGNVQSIYRIWQRDSLDLVNKNPTTPTRGGSLYYAIRTMWKYLIEQKILWHWQNYLLSDPMWYCQVW